MSFLFIDPVAPKPYTSLSLQQPGIGGTEATVIRIAEALGVGAVMQHNRTIDSYSGGKVSYIRPTTDRLPWVTSVVVLRCPHTALATRQRYKSVPIYLWLHDLATKDLAMQLPALKSNGVELICVSNFHRHDVLSVARAFLGEDPQVPPIHVIYNPIEDGLAPDSTPVDPNKLVFFSSPHKGLEYTLDIFKTLKDHWRPNLELYVANPGYLPTPALSMDGVKVLGALPRHTALQHVREAFCVFYPNHVFPETFGLVLAEANAVGTPVLTHALGAAREVLDNPQQLVDTRDRQKLIDTFCHWHPGNRPVVGPDPRFKLSAVTGKWKCLN